ncbi:unnamed protein product [Fraxinus pennsylvanica]|uniref:Uncharacterized protein n=1 Tax=Fraxinus pennsylvanica TaxID=56036 RepID=A0AAD1Z996_9LAMI|nr:unnamed protein product [Fraxinus pennsylvanica]
MLFCFNLPAKLTKAADYPTFASGNHRPYKMDDNANCISSPHYSNSSLSRFSSQAISGQDETRNDVISDQKDIETPSNKWARRKVPMLIPLLVEYHGISTNIGSEFLKFAREKIENVVDVKTKESHNLEVKPLHAFIDEFEQEVQELSHDDDKVTVDGNSEDMKVLWPGSGWTPVPLVDLIEANSVKRSYQKALLCLHPDKLQQKGAASHQKYIAEKVFDILQEAWDHFNAIGL